MPKFHPCLQREEILCLVGLARQLLASCGLRSYGSAKCWYRSGLTAPADGLRVYHQHLTGEDFSPSYYCLTVVAKEGGTEVWMQKGPHTIDELLTQELRQLILASADQLCTAS